MIKYFSVIFICLFPFLCKGQNIQEYLQVTTDCDLYITGEKLHVSIWVEDAEHQPLDMSKVAYVELSDTQKAHVQFMIALENGRGWGEILLPASMHSGTYELSAYTRYMRNYTPDCFYRKHIGVVNLTYKSEEDDLKWAETVQQAPTLQANGLHTDKATYAKRSKVQLQLPKDFHGNASLAVRRLDMVQKGDRKIAVKQAYSGKSSTFYLPELEGHLLSVQAKEKTDSLKQVQMGVMGLTTQVAEGKKSKNSDFLVPMTRVYGHQHIALSGKDAQENLIPITVNSPFAQSLPAELPPLEISYEELPLKYRLLSSQLKEFNVPVKDFTQCFTIENIKPNYIYNLSEYTPMQSIREALVEFVEGIANNKHNGHRALFTTMEETLGYSKQPALVLLDGVPVNDIDKLLKYDARRIHYILIYRGKYTFGNGIYEGIISFTSYNGELPAYQLSENELLYDYDFPQNRPGFIVPDYADTNTAISVHPDFRSLLYWNPQVMGDSCTFYTSDMEGIFEAVLTTFNEQGEPTVFSTHFSVQ